MLNHAAYREGENGKKWAEYKAKHKAEEADNDPVVPEMGIKLSELQKNPAAYEAYMMSI